MANQHSASSLGGMKVAKEARPHVQAALARGWTLSRSRGGHAKLTTPDGRFSTPIPSRAGRHSLVRAWVSRLAKMEEAMYQ